MRADGAPKELPPLPQTGSSAQICRGEEGQDEDADASLLPSLSRRAPARPARGTPLHARAGLGAGETRARGVGRKLFDLRLDLEEEGEASDADEDEAELQRAAPQEEVEEKKPARGTGKGPPDLAELPEGDGHPGNTDREHERSREREADMGRVQVREQQKERAERLRRYHALMELLTTEVGYLLDLRALVTVRSIPSISVLSFAMSRC